MEKLIIERKFNAPIEKIWKEFTDAKLLKKWWSPETMNASYISVDLKVGGLFRFCFKDANDKEFWGRGIYQKINEPTYFSYLDTFTDAEGNVVPPSYFGMEGDKIIESLVEFEFSTEGATTVMKLTMDNYYDTAMKEDMIKGWNSMFDKLAKNL